MKLNCPKKTKNSLPSRKFKVGDLVMYTPHYDDPDGSWVMNGDMGIIIEIKSFDKEQERGYQIIKVRWINDDIDPVDMASDVVKLVNAEEL